MNDAIRMFPTVSPCKPDSHDWHVIDSWPGPGAISQYQNEQLNLVCRVCWRMAWVKPVRFFKGKWEKPVTK